MLGKVKDHAAFGAYMKRTMTSIEEHEPGTILMEVFADETSSAAVLHEVYADADAFMTHSANLMEGSRLQEFLDVFDFKRMTFLNEIDDERVLQVAQQFGAIQAAPVAGFSRDRSNDSG